MGTLLLFSIAVRLVGLGLTIWFLARDRRLPILFLTALLALMAMRQASTLTETQPPWWGGPWPSEFPGLVVSFLVVGVVLVTVRIMRDDSLQFSFWNNVSREAGFAFVNLAPDQTIRRVTANIDELLGLSAEALVGRSFQALTAPESPLQELPVPGALPDLTQGIRREAVLLARDGRPVPVRVFLRFLDNPLN
ncbi:MAG TPA: PAS domain-containing protein, partial [Gammaproteobacteria bacterium]|nr:PAS domain-containing protein [Gammaproteobacteria bacterium]